MIPSTHPVTPAPAPAPTHRPRRSRLFSAAMLAFALSLIGAQLAVAGGFAGQWFGFYTNSTGERGKDSIVLGEGADGGIRGTWSGNIPVAGRRLNGNTAELHGRTSTRAYQLTVTVRGESMRIEYIATRLDSRGSYNGVVDLHRQ